MEDNKKKSGAKAETKKKKVIVEDSHQKELNEALVTENEQLMAEAEELKAKLSASEAKSDDYLGKLAGLKGDFERFKARNKEVAESSKEEGKQYVIDKLLPILDTFDRAKTSVSDEATVAALDLILKQFEKLLGDVGIEEIAVLGEVFDPNTANAVLKQPVEDEAQKGLVTDVVSKGYRYKDKILRYPHVIVGV